MRLFFTWVDRFNCALFWFCAAIGTSYTLESFVSRNAFLYGIHELTHVNKFVSAYLIVAVEIHLRDVAFSQLQVTSTLCLRSVEGTTL